MTRALEFVQHYVMRHFPSAAVAEDRSDRELRHYVQEMVAAAQSAGIGPDELVAERAEIERTLTAALKVAARGNAR
jgi:hypothetical protein